MSDSRPLFTWESLEGEYTSWVHILTFQTNVLYGTQPFPVVDNTGVVYAWLSGSASIVIFDRLGAVLTFATTISNGIFVSPKTSIGNKYYPTCDFLGPNDRLVVYRRGVEIFRRQLNLDLAGCFYSFIPVAISPNGRYIAVFVEIGAADYVLLYEGRP